MSTSNNDLWPDGMFSEPIRAPATILKEQASLLSEKSTRRILGRVEAVLESEYDKEYVLLSMRARVPDLGNFEVELLSLSHDPQQLYPLRARSRDMEGAVVIADEEKLVAWLRRALGSAGIVQTLRTLLAQVKDPDARPPQPQTRGRDGGEVDYGDIPF